MTDLEKKYLPAEPIVAWGSFIILLATYWLTVAPTVSFWDCPEYVSAAYLLEVGHPPGNPVWMLVERMVTLFVPPGHAALAINLSSGIFTAFAAFFLAKTIFRVGLWVLLKLPRRRIPAPLAAAGGALVGALAFGWCDSVWYSAVEAEVYAMSIFMTSLCVWLMTKWAGTRNRGDSWRLLVLIAYLFGLSIGIHQLNLLCIPALAMIWAIRRGIRSTGRLVLIFFLSLVAVGCILTGMMPSTIALAAKFELLAVNKLALPALSGVVIYVLLLGVSLIAAMTAVARTSNRILMAFCCYPAIFLSGIFIISDHFLVGAAVSAVAAALLVSGDNFKARRLYLSIWMLAMLLVGYSSYALIPIRGSVPSPANSAMPDEPFAFASYQSREQYGGKPLLYGPTPYSKTLLRESISDDGKASYRTYALDYKNPIYAPKEQGGRLRTGLPGVAPSDSAENARVMARGGDGYVLRGMHPKPVKTPELNMWFPRITSSNPSDLRSYAEWVGMDSASMTEVDISEAVDSNGNFVTKMKPDGTRGPHPKGLRPTYLQNLQWLATYQTAYMYWRYLLWNFAGRQNDRPAQGEVQHGNFITGFPAVDNAMLGAEDYLPPVAGSENPGRNRYFLLPLLLGIIGMVWLLKSRRRGKQTCGVTAILFIMSGLAITIYLNQDPGEPRERDYSFLGSYLAYCIWIAFGAIMIARRLKSVWGFIIPLAVTIWMGVENYDDHDRSNRYAARNFAFNFLNSLEPDAIVFVTGDNYTFPFWYAVEVEGVRPDVRIVNMSYLNTPVYASNLMRDWRDSKALPMTLRRSDIIWDAFRLTRIDRANRDTVDAVDALRALRESAGPRFDSRYVSLRVSADSTVTYDLANLTSGGGIVDFQKLIMFDIVATNAASGRPRPVYWIGALGPDRRGALTEASSPWLFGYKFGIQPESESDSLMLAAVNKFVPANPPGKKVYMDHAPATMVTAMRGPVVAAARRFLSHGMLDAAISSALKADIPMGDSPDSYGSMSVADTTFKVRKELGLLLMDCADSIAVRAKNPAVSDSQKKKLDALSIELKSRGRMHLREYESRKKAWERYRSKLPPRLQNKMAPVY